MKRAGLRVAWFDSWVGELDDALSELPETPVRPHELYRQLATSASADRKRTALVTEGGCPVAVVALRRPRASLTWKPVTGWIVPGLPFPVRPGYLGPVLDSLGRNLSIPWWRIESTPPDGMLPQRYVAGPRYVLRLEPGYEQYWRQSSQWDRVKKDRRRCRGLALSVNHPLATEWTITNWERSYRPMPDRPFVDLDDRLAAARFLQERGLHLSFCLLDDGWPVAGNTVLVDGNDLVGQYTYRDPAYAPRGVGTRLLDLVVEWALEQGFRSLDLGGGHDYKRRWAPPRGEEGELVLSTSTAQVARTVIDSARAFTAGSRGAGSLAPRLQNLRR